MARLRAATRNYDDDDDDDVEFRTTEESKQASERTSHDVYCPVCLNLFAFDVTQDSNKHTSFYYAT